MGDYVVDCCSLLDGGCGTDGPGLRDRDLVVLNASNALSEGLDRAQERVVMAPDRGVTLSGWVIDDGGGCVRVPSFV